MARLNPLQSAHIAQGLHQDRLVEKDQSIQRLGLGRRSDFAAHSQMIEKRLHLGGAEILRVLFAMKEDVLPDPVAITLFRARAEMAATADGGEHIEQARGLDTPLR